MFHRCVNESDSPRNSSRYKAPDARLKLQHRDLCLDVGDIGGAEYADLPFDFADTIGQTGKFSENQSPVLAPVAFTFRSHQRFCERRQERERLAWRRVARG